MSLVGEVTKKPRTIVLCFDGTAGEYSGNVSNMFSRLQYSCNPPFVLQNTNVVKFVSLLKKDDFNEQLCYYQVRQVSVVLTLFPAISHVLAWHRDMVRPWSCVPHVPVGSQNSRPGFCVVCSLVSRVVSWSDLSI
jgi:hypothetical protein